MTSTSNRNGSLSIREWLPLGCALALILAASYSFAPGIYDLWGDDRSSAIRTLEQDLPALAEKELRALREEELTKEPLTPSLVYEGLNSQVILAGEVLHDTYGIASRESLTYELLARTPTGRYFSVSYRLRLDNVRACLADPESCLGWTFRPVDKEIAMEMVFRDKLFTPEFFRSTFGVDPPSAAASIPA